MAEQTSNRIPPGQQLVAKNKWPIIGERKPALSAEPWKLTLSGLTVKEQTFSLVELADLNQTTLTIDIHCVTRWSRLGVEFTGVLLSDLLKQAGVQQAGRFVSFMSRSERNHSTSLPIDVATDQQTLIALQVDGHDLETDHGGPIRNVVPGRYFYKSVKWLERIEVLEHDRLGFWEAETGYHNNADPWREERYMAPSIDRRTAIRLIESLDFSGHDLRSIDASQRDLRGLNAKNALLRDADFRKSRLVDADFTDANLSNAHLEEADLRGAKFVHTDLEGANLSGADLRNTNFSQASLIGCSFCEFQDGQAILPAIIDATTNLPDSLLEPLTRDQLDFVLSARN